MADNRTMAQMLQAPIECYEDAIAVPPINANNFELKQMLINLEDPPVDPPEVPMADNRTMAKLLQASTDGYEDAIVILEIAANILSSSTQRFDESFYEAWDRFNDLLRACPHHGFSELYQLDTFYNALNVNDQDSLNSAAGGNFLDKMPRKCLKIIENKSKVHQSRAKAVVAKVGMSSSTPAISSEVFKLKDLVRALLLDKKNQSSAPTQSFTPAPVKAIKPNCVTCGGAHSYQNCPATSGNVYQDNIQEYVSQAAAANYNQGNTGFQPQMVANQIRPPGTLPSNTITIPKEDLKGTVVTKDQVKTPSSQSTAPVQPPVAQPKTQTLVSEPVDAHVSVLIPYPSRRDNERRHDQANEQIKKFYKISKEMMNGKNPDERALFGSHPKQVAKKLRDPDKFLIPCEFPGMNECLALVDLGASINPMPLFVWEGLSLLELTSTCMTLELADRSVSKPIGIAKDVSVKVGVFHFPSDFVVVDFEPDPRVPLILGRCFLKTSQALINVQKGELTLPNKIDVICEMYSQEVLGFSDVTTSGNPTPYDDPIVSTTSSTLTPFGDSDLLLFEEVDAFLGLEDDPDSSKINPFYYDPKGDILLLEAILNSKPLPPLPNHEQYMHSYKKELKVCEAKTVKSSVDEPPKV
nr:hypothetical protein [Tanacetum cinerariifolium]